MHPRSQQPHLSPYSSSLPSPSSPSPSWTRTCSGFGNPFQNVPGQFIYALPNLRSFPPPPNATIRSLYTTGPHLATIIESKDEVVNRGNRLNHMPPPPAPFNRLSSPSSSSSSSSGDPSSEEGRRPDAEKKQKRTRRKRQRSRAPPDHGGWVMGPRAMTVPAPQWTLSHSYFSRQSQYDPRGGPRFYYAVFEPQNRGPWPSPPPFPGYVWLPPPHPATGTAQLFLR
jgi:hypothetical protein